MTTPPITDPTPEQLAALRWMLGDATEPYSFTDEQLAAMIVAAGSLEGAAVLGWTARAMAATEARGGMLEYRIGTESVRYLSPADFRQLALENAALWEAKLPENQVGSIYAIVPPTILHGGPLTEVDLSRLEAEALERRVIDTWEVRS